MTNVSKNKIALVIGGSNGIGLAITASLIKRNYSKIYIFDIKKPDILAVPNSLRGKFKKIVSYHFINLLNIDWTKFKQVSNVDTLIITAGFGRVATFNNLTCYEIKNLMQVNMCSIVSIIKHFYKRIHSKNNFYTLVMGSIAGHIASPLFSVYGAAKAGLCSFIENINIELEANGIKNRILDVSPGSLKGTNFVGNKNNLSLIAPLADTLVDKMYKRKTLFIPDYESTYEDVIKRYRDDPHKFGLESYKYKVDKGRVSHKPNYQIGYLSGTFDMFHIGHLNILRKAKNHCDYLIVGIHKDGSRKHKQTFIPLDERKAIVSSISYVDKVVDATSEDSDMWKKLHYDRLFVGSDYKGSERFKNYSKFFKGKGVEIVFFPYTKQTSSSQLRTSLIEFNESINKVFKK